MVMSELGNIRLHGAQCAEKNERTTYVLRGVRKDVKETNIKGENIQVG